MPAPTEPRVHLDDVRNALAEAGWYPLPDGRTWGKLGFQLGQLSDCVMILVSAGTRETAIDLRDSLRRALRERRFMVKDSGAIPGWTYVIGRL